MVFARDPTPAEAALAAAFLVAGFALAYLFERLLRRHILRRPVGSRFRAPLVLLGALRGVAYFWLPLVSLDAVTRILPLSPAALDLVRELTVVLLILVVTLVFVRVVGLLVARFATRSETQLPSISIFTTITQVLVLIVGVLVVLQFLGIAITPMLTALGVAGLAVALALQDTLSNLFAGFHLIASRKIRPGDFIRLDTGEEGYVTDVTWRNTTVRQIPRNSLIIPNAQLAAARVINFHLPARETGLAVEVGVGYDSDLRQVERVTLEVARELRDLYPKRMAVTDPYLRFQAFSDFSINFSVMIFVREYLDQIFIRHEFIIRLHERYRREGITIPFPIRTVEFRPPALGETASAPEPFPSAPPGAPPTPDPEAS